MTNVKLLFYPLFFKEIHFSRLDEEHSVHKLRSRKVQLSELNSDYSWSTAS